MEITQNLEQQAEKVAETLKMLAHPKRLLILCKLSEWEKTVWELEKLCSLSQSQLSQFLGKMKEDWLLEWEKNWLYVSYKIKDHKVKKLLESLSNIYCSNNC